jgi:hypothetical protein
MSISCCTFAIIIIGNLYRTMKSSFPDLEENVVAVASNDVNVTWSTKETVLVPHGSVLFIHASVSPDFITHS